MKKLFVAASLLAASFGAFAQDTKAPAEQTGEGFVSKNGHQVLPQAGDWGVSFNAIPVLNYLGNAFSNAGTNTISAGFPSSGAISVRKFKDASTAYRAQFRFNLGSNTQKFNSISSTDPTATVEDKFKRKNTDILLGLGLEKRKGTSRIQGIYGALAQLGIFGSKNDFDYGNAITGPGALPPSHEFAASGGNNIVGTSRVTSQKITNGFSLGVVGFVGAEYFIAPKLSLGAEFQWGPALQIGGKLKTESQSWNGTSVVSNTSTLAGNSGLSLNTAVTNINLNFFF